MSQLLIQQYLNQLAMLKKVSGTTRESVVREAFKDLLKGMGRSHDLIPPEAWDYRLGNRSALEWILDQYKESKPKDPTIREKFDTYRFADYKEKVIDLLMRVTTVSVETQKIAAAMKSAAR